MEDVLSHDKNLVATKPILSKTPSKKAMNGLMDGFWIPKKMPHPILFIPHEPKISTWSTYVPLRLLLHFSTSKALRRPTLAVRGIPKQRTPCLQ